MINGTILESKVEFDLNTQLDDRNNNNSNAIDLNDAQHAFKIPAAISISDQNPKKNSSNNAIPVQKIARDSLIHKNDVFQFDDVESVHTHDSLLKSTPQSSFESENTFKSNTEKINVKSGKKRDCLIISL